jgi:hypothetical protein
MQQVAVDGNCVTYLVDALKAIVEPTDSLSSERKALAWLLFQGTASLCTVPANQKEVAAIAEELKRSEHLSWLSSHISTCQTHDEEQVIAQTNAYLPFHRKVTDCRAVAEASSAGCVAYLTKDRDLIGRLAPLAKPMLVALPSEYWASLAVPHGTARWQPDASGPLASQSWLRW